MPSLTEVDDAMVSEPQRACATGGPTHEPVRNLTIWLPVIFEGVFLLVSPVAAWLVLGIGLINQDGYIDPWYYTGYGRAFPTLLSQFGWTYYAVRFPVIFLNSVFAWQDPIAGSAMLRYALLLACGLPLYLWARRAFGRVVAASTYLVLFCCPLLPRILLWDLTTFVSVPMALAGSAVWLWSSSGRARFLSGFCWMAAVASHAFTGTAVGTFVIVQLVRRIRAREFRQLFVRDIALTGVGAAVCLMLGWVYYRVRIGPFEPQIFYTVTANVVAAGNRYAEAHRTPFHAWAAREYHVYVPVLCVILAGVLLGRRVLHNTAVSSVWWFGIGYCTLYLVDQFVLGRFVLETFYYFAHLTVVVFVLVPVIVNELLREVPKPARNAAGLAIVAGLVVLPLMNGLDLTLADSLLWPGFGNTTVLGGLALVSFVLVLTARGLARRAIGGTAAAVSFMLLVQTLTLLNPAHRYVFDSRHRAREQGVYVAAVDMLSVFKAYATPKAHVMLWYCPKQAALGSIASAVLLHTVHNPFTATPEACHGTLGAYERQRLSTYPVRYVLMLDEGRDSFSDRDRSLQREGYSLREVVSRTIGDDAYYANLRLVQLTGGSR